MKLREACKLNKEELKSLQKELLKKAKESNLNAYIGYEESGEGVPILIKDNIQVKNWPITCASKILQGYIAPYDAEVIKKLKANGFAPTGRANMDEFAMGSTTESSFYGPTKNPHDLSRVPGGSSGGSAAAVAAGLAIAALGSDTGGSIRQPASYCGVVGFKPTYGKVSRYGLSAYASSLDQIGPITQDVTDAAFLYDIIAGYDEKDSTSANIAHTPIYENLDSSQKYTIAVIDNYMEAASDDVKEAMQKAIEALKDAGHTIIHENLLNTKYDIATYYIIATAEAATNLGRYDGVRYGYRAKGAKNSKDLFFKTRSEGFGEEVKRRILLGNFVLSSGYYDAYYIKAQKVRHLIKEEYNKIFARADLILAPIAPSVAPKLGQIQDPLDMYKNDMYTLAINLVGLPALSLPIMKNKENLPVGLQLIGKAFNEQPIFNTALSLEERVNYKG